MKIKRIALMFAFVLFALAIPLWASVGEDYPGEMPDRGRDIISDADGYETADTEYSYDGDYTSGRNYSEAVAIVNVSGTTGGIINVAIPNYANTDFMAFATEYDIEFFVSPPEGMHFSPETALGVSGGVNVTFGPVVRGCGRLFFVVSAHSGEDNVQVATPTVDIIFYPGDGGLPLGESGSLSGPVGLLVANAPAPYPPTGFNFAGWQHNGIRVNFPFYAAASMTLEAIYEPIPPGDASGTTFTLTLRPQGGSLPPGEPLSRALPINSMISELPAPTRSGYLFGGWLDGSRLASSPVFVTNDMELTAVWMRAAEPVSLSTNANTNTGNSPQAAEAAAPNILAAVFDPNPGAFASGETGLRSGAYGTYISNIPVPTLSGYIFTDWRLPNGQVLQGNLNIREDIRLTAIWVPIASPTPSPTPAPTPPPPAGTLPNPQTSPIQISFMIFGTVMIAGIAALSIMKISRKQMAAGEEYRAKIARYNREKRIIDLMDE
ncbi:MAG: InlB B-repeat-containing protein [Defluviitaleaceae bacterium]|nr:InlB B-repeat-containing protein [Defluviitaleaceae bacterium]